MNQNEKLERFAEEINKNATAMCKKIEAKTQKATKQQLDAFTAKATAEFEARAAYETNRLHTESNREIAALQAQVKRAAALHREEIMNEVFEMAKARLLAFTDSDAYAKKLRACMERLADRLGDGCVIFVRESDAAAANELCRALPQVAEVRVRASIAIGLAAACNKEETLFLDDTLDSRLHTQKADFLLSSGLTLAL